MNRTRKKQNTYNDLAIDELITKYGCSRDYILKSIRGDRTGTKPTIIQDEYKQLDRASRMAVKTTLKKTLKQHLTVRKKNP